MISTESKPGDNALADYQIWMSPNDDLAQKIQAERNRFSTLIRLSKTHPAKPILPLVFFKQYASMEARICQQLRVKTMAWAPFNIELLNFGSLPTHSIFIPVVSKLSIQNLVRSIRADMQGQMKPNKDSKPFFFTDYSFFLGQKLKPWQYEAGWHEYQHRNFSGKCLMQSLCLMKKIRPEDPFRLVERFEFQDIRVLPKQGVMF